MGVSSYVLTGKVVTLLNVQISVLPRIAGRGLFRRLVSGGQG